MQGYFLKVFKVGLVKLKSERASKGETEMGEFTAHELEIIEVALVRYMKRLESGVFAERERRRIQVILEKIDELTNQTILQGIQDS